jgi:ketosteroid isomerase-like protein
MTDANDPDEVLAVNEAFYASLGKGSIDGIAAICAQDDRVTVLHEDSREVAVGWPAVLATWKAIPFDAFAELAVAMPDPQVRTSGDVAWVTGLENIRGRMTDGAPFSWIALGTNVYERRHGRWLMVHHHASKGTASLVDEH